MLHDTRNMLECPLSLVEIDFRIISLPDSDNLWQAKKYQQLLSSNFNKNSINLR